MESLTCWSLLCSKRRFSWSSPGQWRRCASFRTCLAPIDEWGSVDSYWPVEIQGPWNGNNEQTKTQQSSLEYSDHHQLSSSPLPRVCDYRTDLLYLLFISARMHRYVQLLYTLQLYLLIVHVLSLVSAVGNGILSLSISLNFSLELIWDDFFFFF